MRWDGDGDGADGGDGVDDDPDDAWHDGDDDGGDSPSGREIPRQISPYRSPSSLCLVSASWRRRNNSLSPFSMFLGHRVIARKREPERGHRGQGRAPAAALGGPAVGGRTYPLSLTSSPPSGSVTHFPEY